MNSKYCTRCKLLLPLSEFTRHTGHKDGYSSRCRGCRSITRREFKCIERDMLIAQSLRRCTKCHKIKSLNAFYNRPNSSTGGVMAHCKTCKDAGRRIYRQENREAVNKRAREWYQANPEKRRAIIERRRVRKKQVGGFFDGNDIVALQAAQTELCIYCRSTLKNGYHIDHITPLSRGGNNNPTNLQLLCAHCNLSKKDKTHEEFLVYRKSLQF